MTLQESPGYRGATQDRWGKDSIYELVKEIRDSHPHLDEKAKLELYREKVRDDEGYFKSETQFCWRHFSNLLTDQQRRDQDRIAPVERAARIKVATEKATKKLSAAIISKFADASFIMPNGLALRDCTFAYVAKLGLGFTKLGKMGKPNQRIGDVLSDAKIKKVLA